MTAESLMRVLLDLDQQWLTSRPSPWGNAAVLIARLCDAAEDRIGLRDPSQIPKVLGNWRDVDLSVVDQPSPRELSQPHLDALTASPELTAIASWLTYTLPDSPGYFIRGLSGGPWATAEEAWAALVEHCVGTDKGEDQS